MIDKKKIKERIARWELRCNGLNSMNGAFVDVLNLRVKKSENLVIADIKFVFDEEGKIERYDDCEYPLDKLGI